MSVSTEWAAALLSIRYPSIVKVKLGKKYNNRLRRGEGQDGKSPSSLLFQPISPSSLLFQPISPSSLNFHLQTALWGKKWTNYIYLRRNITVLYILSLMRWEIHLLCSCLITGYHHWIFLYYMQDCYSRLSYSESSSRSETYIGGIQSHMLIIVPFYSLKVIIKSSRRFENSVRTRASR